MQMMLIREKDVIEKFLRPKAYLHLYALGDLDDFFWPHTAWYGLFDEQRLRQLALVYTGSALPVLLALTDGEFDLMVELLRRLRPRLPEKFYAHLSGELSKNLAENYAVTSYGLHFKMALTDYGKVKAVETENVQRLDESHAVELRDFYAMSYPGNWFDARMLQTGCYFGLRQDTELASVGGVHTYSPQYSVAALGNVATHPRWRGRGLAGQVCAKLCQALSENVKYIGLNVKADNTAARTCYESLGFEVIATYEECLVEVSSKQ